jgi:hypothetical protein
VIRAKQNGFFKLVSKLQLGNAITRQAPAWSNYLLFIVLGVFHKNMRGDYAWERGKKIYLIDTEATAIFSKLAIRNSELQSF